ncbi:MAG: excinuclease ABC subunit UvrC [Deltaproteobacteria bacterium]|nr:MAG: excinuclease ABC subunit UvrC [Deltaproteobacteria bacterium]
MSAPSPPRSRSPRIRAPTSCAWSSRPDATAVGSRPPRWRRPTPTSSTRRRAPDPPTRRLRRYRITVTIDRRELADRAAGLPRQPGVYLWKDAHGRVLYVGKAKDVRARVRQYLNGHDTRFMVRFLVEAAADIECVVVRSEKEALILENTLIKKHRPRYNAKLVDDSSFLHVRIDPRERWPAYSLVRSIEDDGARYLGPYHSASRARATLAFLERRFALRTCSDAELRSRTRPCLLHQMGRCLAPCVGLCSKEEYAAEVEQSLLFLEGRDKELLRRLEARMHEHARHERFEQAARDRDLIRAVRASIERQSVSDRRLGERDIWAVYRDTEHGDGEQGVVLLLPVRRGLMQEALPLPFQEPLPPVSEDEDGEAEGALLSTFLNRWYSEGSDIPGELLLSTTPSDKQALEEVLSERRGAPVHIHVPVRGDKRRLVDIALRNARHAMTRDGGVNRSLQALEDLQAVCRLPRLPRRIECFDNSNIQGSDAVAAMVVFIDGRPAPAEYRRYRVKTVVGADDYATMREILHRRFTRALDAGTRDDRRGWGRPDLLVVDGGRGQVNAARAVLADLGIHDVPLIGLSKPRTERRRGERDATDKIVIPGVKEPVRLRHNRPALNLLQALRDESHRTAIGYHRKVRRQRNLGSVLDSLPGVGPARRKALLAHFGSVRALRSATARQIAEVDGIGPVLAERIASALANREE